MDDRLTIRIATLVGFFAICWFPSAPVVGDDVTPVSDGTNYDLRYKFATGDVLLAFALEP